MFINWPLQLIYNFSSLSSPPLRLEQTKVNSTEIDHLPGVESTLLMPHIYAFHRHFKSQDCLHEYSHLLQAKGFTPVWESM